MKVSNLSNFESKFCLLNIVITKILIIYSKFVSNFSMLVHNCTPLENSQPPKFMLVLGYGNFKYHLNNS